MLSALLCVLQGIAPAATPFPPATPESQGISAEALAELDGIVAGYVEKGWVVGAE